MTLSKLTKNINDTYIPSPRFFIYQVNIFFEQKKNWIRKYILHGLDIKWNVRLPSCIEWNGRAKYPIKSSTYLSWSYPTKRTTARSGRLRTNDTSSSQRGLKPVRMTKQKVNNSSVTIHLFYIFETSFISLILLFSKHDIFQWYFQ